MKKKLGSIAALKYSQIVTLNPQSYLCCLGVSLICDNPSSVDEEFGLNQAKRTLTPSVHIYLDVPNRG